jgi:sulfur carrier protein ThiS adenylyltransferase
MEMELNHMPPAFIASPTSIHLKGTPVPGAEDRQQKIAGFDQQIFSASGVVCIGAGGLICHIAPTLVRKGIGSITLVDDDIVEPSNLNRQHFYAKDIGRSKALALAENLLPECIARTEIRGAVMRLEDAIAGEMDLVCDLAICGVDNNPARVAASRYFRSRGVPVIFCAVSLNGNHGYVFVQESRGACIGCLFPDITGDDRFPCPGTPAIADILQGVGALGVYAVDTLIMDRTRSWNYRSLSLSSGSMDASAQLPVRSGCDVLEQHCGADEEGSH